jgi:coenzyme Q-binding protein COQ10
MIRLLHALLALIPTLKRYSTKELYAVVADVASYPKFVPFCLASRVAASTLAQAMQRKTVVDAELTVGFMSFKESYVSTVTCIPYESVQVRCYHLFQCLVINFVIPQASASSSTPLFKNLSTTWKFQSTSSPESTATEGLEDRVGPTLVSYDLAYEFANPLHSVTSATFFGQIAGMMIKAFEDRCWAVYGKRLAPNPATAFKSS